MIFNKDTDFVLTPIGLYCFRLIIFAGMDQEIVAKIRRMAGELLNQEVTAIRPLPPSGSNRQYFRISGGGQSIIAAFNPNQRENEAFVHLGKVFSKKQLNVPEVLAYHKDEQIYFLQDLGDDILFNHIEKNNNSPAGDLKKLLETALRQLLRFQTETPGLIDFSLCYPRQAFDRQSIQWDLNYFKYNFLNLAGIPYDEQKLEEDFRKMIDLLLQAPADYFLYRDFQSRNVMIHQNELYFIDYQGGRKGPLQYDVASFLFQVRANFPWALRRELLDVYLDELSSGDRKQKAAFMEHFPAFVQLRLLQVLGAYGFRGLFEKKAHFLKSIPWAAKLLEELPEHYPPEAELPELERIFAAIIQKYRFEEMQPEGKLKIRISSFSYKKGGIPVDLSGNGGGHVFDCRALPNPGRIESLKDFTGKDRIIIDYLEEQTAVGEFLENVYHIVEQSVENYRQRNFSDLMVNFGCTGGQHRSVYCAEKLKQHLEKKFDVAIELSHNEFK